jgi:Flp pilus assembly protein TadD
VHLRELVAVGVAGFVLLSGLGGTEGAAQRSFRPIAIDYPEDGSIFPQEITPPTFLWRDGQQSAVVWRVEVAFADGAPRIRATSAGRHLRAGRIDPECISATNELPKLTPRQAAERTWAPEPGVWESIKKHSRENAAVVTITGFADAKMERPVSRGRVTIRTSRDAVGAPIFYRDVPLMPSETQKGVIKPLANEAVRLIAWRVRDIGRPQSRAVMENVPICANCHSFSGDGKTLGMDLDGLQNNKGLYTLTPVAGDTRIREENVIQWSTAEGRLNSALRVGFMSQVSPDGRYVVTTIDPEQTTKKSNYYVANFKDYRFLQVFYPTRGVLMWYSRATGKLQPLPGADDPRFVQMGAVWSPDGKYLVFARAEAKEPDPPGAPPARFANDPNEVQMRYDLWRIPFNDGKGGTPEPVAGASRNGMSNSFPKISPDGRWIVFVQARNGLLMRPDSRLYIVPAPGGAARAMRCNTPLMNSWHSFSPNSRWLVFSSKARSPYTQMYLTHIGEDGSDSPAILVENATAANRAVNIPEFVNIAPDGLASLGGPAVDYYRRFDRAMYLQKAKRFDEAAAEWRKVLEIKPRDSLSRDNLGMTLMLGGRREEAGIELRKARELKLRKAIAAAPSPASYNSLGNMLLDAGRTGEAIAQFEKAMELDPGSAQTRSHLGKALAAAGRLDEACAQLRKAVEIDPKDAEAHAGLGAALYARGEFAAGLRQLREAIELSPNDRTALRQAAWALATCPEPQVRSGSEAVALAVRAVQLSGGRDAAVLDALAAAYAEKQQFSDALLTARRALASAAAESRRALADGITRRIRLYEAKQPFRGGAGAASGGR